MSEIKISDLDMLEIERERFGRFFRDSANVLALFFLDGLCAGHEATYTEIRDYVCHKLNLHKSKFGKRKISDLERDHWIKLETRPKKVYKLTETGKEMAGFLKQGGMFSALEIEGA